MDLCRKAKAAAELFRGQDPAVIDKALIYMQEELLLAEGEILEANARDVSLAQGSVSDVMIDRLRLTKERIASMAKGIGEIAALPTPLGICLEKNLRPNGLRIEKVTVPMGVIAIIYESRPNVTSDAAALAVKSGNVCVLRSGKEAYGSSLAIVTALKRGLKRAELSEDVISLVSDTSRASAIEPMEARGFVDMLIPRGGKGLISACVENSKVPCLETGTGICHIYVDGAADMDMALSIIENAKTSRPSVCNAEEVLLVDKRIAGEFLPKLKARLTDDREREGKTPVELRLDPEAAKIIQGTPAQDTDFDTEFLDYILAVKVVSGVSDACRHIALHSTSHSEAIITEDEEAMEHFTKNVDSAAVYVNASTRFTDGGEFGLGCEMGISTQKLHARGPLGIRELVTYKYIVRGNGQIRR